MQYCYFFVIVTLLLKVTFPTLLTTSNEIMLKGRIHPKINICCLFTHLSASEMFFFFSRTLKKIFIAMKNILQPSLIRP